MAKFITELLTDLSDNPVKIAELKDNYAIRTILQYAFDKNLKFLLPEGTPPFKPDSAPLGMSPANFYQQVKKLYIFTRPDLQKIRMEQLFVQLCEGLHPSEADVCIAIKDQNLGKLFPGITAELVVNAGIVSQENCVDSFRVAEPVAVEQAVAETEGRTLVVNLTDGVAAKEQLGSAPDETAKTEKRGRGRPKKA